jgi:hypothetical protein
MKDELLQQLKMYEGKWVALLGTDDDMSVVAAGEDAAEATERAAKKGHTETTLLKVLPSEVAYVPFA